MIKKNIKIVLTIILLYLSLNLVNVAYCYKDTMIDLTYPFDNKTIYWPTEKGFKLRNIFYGKTSKKYFYSSYKFCAPEHGGTHVDAPSHFSHNGLTIDKIPLDALRGKVVVINVVASVKNDANYAIRVTDIKKFEKQYRTINSQDIVLFYTGWGKYWGNKKRYLGSDKLGDTKDLHFPGISKDAAQYLATKKVKAVGLDTPSLDPGVSLDFWAHRIILGANIYGIENIANLHSVPAIGAELIVAPMKIKSGSGAPARLYIII